ncbi:MAG: nicotinamide mononucleotide transporter [Clostridia bacterium]|nr:nicotinamide mononucleotide transporter [Clostridia bacterium]
MKLYNPFRYLSKFEWVLWIVSLFVVTVSFLIGGSGGILALCTSLVGVTALIFVTKGDVTGQILTVTFSLLYAIVSFFQAYYGEMITYLCMSAPAAVFSIVSWLKNPYGKDHFEVRMAHLSKGKMCGVFLLSLPITLAFYWILRFLGTAQLPVSTLSVTTSFLASILLFLRSPYYALAYTANDVVLIVLWIVASKKEPSALSMVACFLMFLINDLYGFLNWKRLRKRQDT